MSGASDDADVVGVVCGPTAAGKSAVAMWLAQRARTTIISADSRQVYRGFDIGTAKPSARDVAAVEHHGLDVIDPTERYSAAAWADAANDWIAEARAEAATPLVVGGTGLYIRALFDGLFDEPRFDGKRRERLAVVLGSINVPELRRWVNLLDPPRAHLGRTQLIRSIEVALLSGRRITDLHRERARTARWRPRYLLVDPGPALGRRIAGRIDQMLDQGWPDEVQQLMRTIPPDAPAWKATGYETVRGLVAGVLSRDQAREKILIATRQYAKRQRTWFRHQLPARLVTVVDPSSPDWKTRVAEWSEATYRKTSASP